MKAPILAACACGANDWVLKIPLVGTDVRPRRAYPVPFYKCLACGLKRDAR